MRSDLVAIWKLLSNWQEYGCTYFRRRSVPDSSWRKLAPGFLFHASAMPPMSVYPNTGDDLWDKKERVPRVLNL